MATSLLVRHLFKTGQTTAAQELRGSRTMRLSELEELITQINAELSTDDQLSEMGSLASFATAASHSVQRSPDSSFVETPQTPSANSSFRTQQYINNIPNSDSPGRFFHLSPNRATSANPNMFFPYTSSPTRTSVHSQPPSFNDMVATHTAEGACAMTPTLSGNRPPFPPQVSTPTGLHSHIRHVSSNRPYRAVHFQETPVSPPRSHPPPHSIRPYDGQCW